MSYLLTSPVVLKIFEIRQIEPSLQNLDNVCQKENKNISELCDEIYEKEFNIYDN